MEKYTNLVIEAEQNKLLQNVIFSLLRLINIYQSIIEQLPGKNRLLYNAREQIIEITDKWIKRYSLKQISRFLKINQQQYMSWKKGFYCKFSPVLLCRKAILNQLTIKEVTLIKEAVTNPEHENWSLISIYYKIIRESKVFFSDRTFYKYVAILGLRQSKNKKIKKKARGQGPKSHFSYCTWILQSIGLQTALKYIYML